jgi:acyl-homoserine lactone acylase PvdQ
VPGWIKTTDWGPFLPFSDNPQLLNPPTGFLQNCNNPPWLATKHSGLRPLEPAPYYLEVTPRADAGEEALNLRGERVFQVLAGNTKFSFDDMKSLALDTYVLSADVIVPLLDRAYTPLFSFWPSHRDPRVSRALELLRTWDRRSAATSVAFTYLYFWGRAYEDLYSYESFHRFTGYARRNIQIDSWLEQYRARRALEAALDRIQKLFGRTEVPWGQVNVTIRGGTFPMDGTGLYDVLHPDDGPEQSNGEIFDNDGWGHLMIVMEGEPKEIWSLLPYGESDDPSHRTTTIKPNCTAAAKSSNSGSRHNKSETTRNPSGATVVALAGTFDCRQSADPKHVSGKPDFELSRLSLRVRVFPAATLFGSVSARGKARHSTSCSYLGSRLRVSEVLLACNPRAPGPIRTRS